MRSAYDLDTPRVDPQPWRTRALCTPAVAEWFWPVTVGRISLKAGPAHNAILLCEQCPVIADCDAWERANPSVHTHIAAGRIWSR